MIIQKVDPTEACEAVLIEDRQYNIDHKILRSENAVIDRLLNRRPELIGAYEELWTKLHDHPNALKTFFGVVTTTAAFWSPEDIATARDARVQLEKVNADIADTAAHLSALLTKRDELNNGSHFHSDTYYEVLQIVEDVSVGNYRFQTFVRDDLRALKNRFDLKYWPALSEVVGAIGLDAGRAVVQATDPLTDASTSSARPSLSDFFRALFASIEENRACNHSWLPNSFRATDGTIASLANCALDLEPDELTDSAYVKRLRQRERERQVKSVNSRVGP